MARRRRTAAAMAGAAACTGAELELAAIIYAFPPPAPSTAAVEKGLAAVLAEYRAFAGQLGEAPDGTPPCCSTTAARSLAAAAAAASR